MGKKVKNLFSKGKNKSKSSKTSVKVANKDYSKKVKRGIIKPKVKSKFNFQRNNKKQNGPGNKKSKGPLDTQNQVVENGNQEFELEDIFDMLPKSELKKMSPHDVHPKKRTHQDDDSDLSDLELYEKKPRNAFIEKQPQIDVENDMNPSVDEQTNGDSNDFEIEENLELEDTEPTFLDILAIRESKLEEFKQKVGNLALTIISYPENNIKRLREILNYLDAKSQDSSQDETSGLFLITFHRLVAFSVLEVFKDILPQYRVREKLDEEEEDKTGRKLRKDTKKLRDYERSLLQLYKFYLNRLQRMVDCLKKDTSKRSNFYSFLKSRTQKERIAEIGVRCLSELLTSHPHFNYQKIVIDILIPLVGSYKYKSLADISFDAICKVFEEDKLGEVSLEITKSTTKHIKALGFNVHPKVLKTFLHLKIKDVKHKEENVKDMDAIRKKVQKMSKKERKRNKKMLQLENHLLESEAQESVKRKLNFHTEILNQIFVNYFRILKQNIYEPNDDLRRKEQFKLLLTPVLEGLSKFAQLINLDFFDDLINMLYKLLESEIMDDNQTLYALNTVFIILSADGSLLNIDPQRFYSQLYKVLLSIDANSSVENFETLFGCLNSMILKKKKQMTTPRILAFVKRIATIALQNLSSGSLLLLSSLRNIMMNHRQADTLLDTEDCGTGVFNPYLDDPEYCHANTTRLWELHILRHHYHNLVGKFAVNILNEMKTNDLKAEVSIKNPLKLFMDSIEESIDIQKNVQNVSKNNRVHNYIYSKESLMSTATQTFLE